MAFATMQSLMPTPTVYAKVTIIGSKRDKVKDPKVELQIANVGFGTMYVENAVWQLDGKDIEFIGDEIGKIGQSWRITSESFARQEKAYTTGCQSTIFTARPPNNWKDEMLVGKEWCDPLIDTLAKRNLSLKITYKVFNTAPPSGCITKYITKCITKEKVIPVFTT